MGQGCAWLLGRRRALLPRGRRESWCRGARPGGEDGDLARPCARPVRAVSWHEASPEAMGPHALAWGSGEARRGGPGFVGDAGRVIVLGRERGTAGLAGVDLAGLVQDGGHGCLLVVGDQVQVAGVVVASVAAGCAVGAGGGDAGSAVGDGVFECLQVLEPAPLDVPGGGGHCVITAHTIFPLPRVWTPQFSLSVSTSRSPRPRSASGSSGTARAGLWWLASQTAAMTCCRSEQSQTRTGGVPGVHWPS